MKDNLVRKGPLRQSLRAPVYVLLVIMPFGALSYFYSLEAGIVISIGIGIGWIITLYLGVRLGPVLNNELVACGLSCKTTEREMLAQIEVPYVVMDGSGRLVWGNDSFSLLTGREPLYSGNIVSVFPELAEKDLEKSAAQGIPVTVSFRDRIYRMDISVLNLSGVMEEQGIFEGGNADSVYYGICFIDETELRNTQRIYEEEKTAAALLYLDNYEEALESVEEVRRSLLFALIDRKISKYFAEYDGIVRKLEKDKYFVILNKKSLEQLREVRFDILEDVKTVNIGNTMPITLSIGVGLGGTSLRQNNEYARIAIEMALGRGGDQAVVKDGSVITYWGGKSLQVEKSTRVKARMKAQALKEFITAKDSVVVMGHKITDVDALGAAVGIYRAARTLGKKVHIVINDPTTSIKPLVDGFLNNPEYEPEMFVDSERAKDLIDPNNTLVVVVDTNKPSYTECPELLNMSRTIVVLDHHRRGNEFIENAVLSYVEPYASSTCEMVAEILQYFSEDLRLRSTEADCIYAGIVVDTNNFITRSGVRTFEAAAYLRRNGADITKVRKLLRDNIDSYKAKAEAVRTAEIYGGFFAIGICPSDGLESPTVVGAQAANELLNIAGVKASFVLTRFNDQVYISARAIDEINVQVMMEELGGGGHMNIAGAQVQGTVEEARDMLKQIIDHFLEKNQL